MRQTAMEDERLTMLLPTFLPHPVFVLGPTSWPDTPMSSVASDRGQIYMYGPGCHIPTWVLVIICIFMEGLVLLPISRLSRLLPQGALSPHVRGETALPRGRPVSSTGLPGSQTLPYKKV